MMIWHELVEGEELKRRLDALGRTVMSVYGWLLLREDRLEDGTATLDEASLNRVEF